MAKGVTIAEMEQNFIDCKKTGIWAATNWIVGFPTEDYQDYSDTMTFLWRMRNNNINNAGLGVGYGMGPETIVGQHPHKFNISWHKYQGHWIRNDFTFGGTHLMIRVKTWHMFADFLRGVTDVPISYPVRHALEKEHYKIKLNHSDMAREIEYEKFDYNIIKPNINPFADALVNEMWPFLRMLWKCRGGYEAEIRYNPEIDLKEFGQQFGPGMFNAVYKFKISDSGKWEADFDMKFEQIDNPFDDRERPPLGRKGPFYAQDYSRMMSNTALRARKLAKPTWSDAEGRDGQDFTDLLNEETELNKNVDFSFDYHYIGYGNWGNYKDFEVEVSNRSREIIPEKEAMSALDFAKEAQIISIDSIKRKSK
jgi:hypothetical protein